MDDSTRIDKLESDVGEIKSSLSEMQTVIFGPSPNRNDGLILAFNNLCKRIEEEVAWGHNVWNIKRREECLGLAKCKDLEKKIESVDKKEEKLIAAKINLKGIYFMGTAQLIGTIIVALIASGVFK